MSNFFSINSMSADRMGNLYVIDYFYVRFINSTLVQTLAGHFADSGHVDGPGNVAVFNYPSFIVVPYLNPTAIYVGDGNTIIRRINCMSGLYLDFGTCIVAPTSQPTTFRPTMVPTLGPSYDPSTIPSISPTSEPSLAPTCIPSSIPSLVPSDLPSMTPSLLPSPDSFATSISLTLYPSLSANAPNPTLAPTLSTTFYVPSIQVTTVAGSGYSSGADGIGTDAEFNDLLGACMDPSATFIILYESDFDYYSIRYYNTSTQRVSTVGTGRYVDRQSFPLFSP